MIQRNNIVTDGRVGAAICRRFCDDLEIPRCYIWMTRFGYIEWSSRVNIDYKISSAEAEYKGKRYGVKFFDGCFNPYIVEL